ncbi:MAG: hypothetical protein VKJ24_19885 [Synechococcales bacterium]|nr:hypothetical protein [Synechococcales bacterium]
MNAMDAPVPPLVTPMITPNLIRQLWNLVEDTQTSLLLRLDDATLVHWLTQQLRSRQPLSQEEEWATRRYIEDRLPLIRDMA